MRKEASTELPKAVKGAGTKKIQTTVTGSKVGNTSGSLSCGVQTVSAFSGSSIGGMWRLDDK